MPHFYPAAASLPAAAALPKPVRPVRPALWAVALFVLLSGCGPAPPGSGASARPTANAVAPTDAATAALLALAEPNLVLLLLPDGEPLSEAPVTAWLDAAAELGIRLMPVSDKQFMALGPQALKFAGLILPDQIHNIATDALLTAVREFTQTGGHVMLVYDFGIFRLDGNQKPTYPIPGARLSDLAGVSSALDDKLREKSAVFGPVTAMRSTLRQLLVPPGKSIAYTALAGEPTGASAYTPVASAAANPAAADADADALHAYSG